MKEFLAIAGALSDQSRVRVLMALLSGELCVCQIIELLGLAPSTVSKHMLILKQADLVTGKKSGRWIYYRLAENAKSTAVQETIALARRHLTNDPQIKQDARRLKQILKHNPVDVCRKQKKAREPIVRVAAG